MEIDKTTLNDLSVFGADEEISVFGKLNLAYTTDGKQAFAQMLLTPLKTVQEIEEIQQVLKLLIEKENGWTNQITNGTIMVVEKFFTASIDDIPAQPTKISAAAYKIFSAPDFSLVKYSAKHCFEFIKGMQHLTQLFSESHAATPLKKLLEEANNILTATDEYVLPYKTAENMPATAILRFAHFIRYRFKRKMQTLLHLHAQLDAWHGMALAVKKYGLVFPGLMNSPTPVVEAKGLYHILLQEPVAYDATMNRETNFMFLTGANMAGKSTFIRAVGIAVFLAHAGMGVPAALMRLSVFDGLLSNINMADNIVKGESYFYNEVQRIKSTVQKVSNGKKWLILIDELFKGTNVQDAMKCSTTVIEGLIKVKNSLFILSTHLYEIGEALKQYPNISFHYFETKIDEGQLLFNYTLKPGISNDRLGYLILKNEGVVKMLEEL